MNTAIKFSQTLLVLCFSLVSFAADFDTQTIFCADIGASKTCFREMPSIAPDEQALAVLSHGLSYCQSSRPLCTTNVMQDLPKGKMSCVCIGLPCPFVDGEPKTEGDTLKDLRGELVHRFGETCNIILANDAENWLKGALFYRARYRHEENHAATLMITLGTAVGLAYFDGQKIMPLELIDFNIDFSHTDALLGLDERTHVGKWDRYLMLGKMFFQDVCTGDVADAVKSFKNSGDTHVQYRALARAVINDIVSGLEKEFKIQKLIFTGGNCAHFEPSLFEPEHKAMILKDAEGFSAAIIPLLAIYFENRVQSSQLAYD